MAATSIFPVPVVVLLVLGGFGLPLGIPPQPEDPLMSKVAPEECLFYTTWAGTATPDPNSTNQTEQLLAEPEIKHLLTVLEQKITAGFQETAGQDADAAPIINDASKWGKRLLMSPAAIFVSKAEITEQAADVPDGVSGQAEPDLDVDVRGGMLVKVGPDVAELKAVLEKYQEAFLKGMTEPVTISGASCYRVNLPPPVPPVVWGVRGQYLIVGVGEGEVEGMLNRAVTPPPQWLTAIRERLNVPRQATMTYINAGTLIDKLAPMGGEQAATAIEALGLKNVGALASVTGLDQEGIVSRTLIGIGGEPQGLLAALVGGQLTGADLAPVPSDATIALAAKLDAEKLLGALVATADKIQPGTGDEILGELGNMEEELGVNLRRDLLAPLGDSWCVYNSPSEGGLVVTGLTAVVKVDDHATLKATETKLLQVMTAALEKQGGRRAPRIAHFAFAGNDVYMFNARDDGFPLAPSWCLTEKELIVAPYPQNVKAYLLRGADYQSLAVSPAVAGLLKTTPAPTMLAYVDTKSLFELVYPIVPIIGQFASAEAAREGIDFDVSILPSAGCISRHLRPDVMVVRRTEAGIEIISRRTNPVLSVGSAVPTSIAVLLPAFSSARTASRRVVAMNNLKIIGMAMHMYHEDNAAFPPAYSVDKNGKPLLSWRVLLLPYLDDTGLYEKFRLDEPWDSEHNRTLIESMPPVYQSPGCGLPPDMTTYLTVRGPSTVFPGTGKLKLNDIPDGASNTAMVVEAATSVPWTKPDDLPLSPENPAASLFGLRKGGCNIVFCDGHVQFVADTTDPAGLKKMFQRNDTVAAEDTPAAPDGTAPAPETPPAVPNPFETPSTPPAVPKKPAPDDPFGAPSTPPAVPAPAPSAPPTRSAPTRSAPVRAPVPKSAPAVPAPAPGDPFGVPSTPPAVPAPDNPFE